MRFRKLRITWTVFCGIACVLLIALWVRSYWRGDVAHGQVTATKALTFQSFAGSIDVVLFDMPRVQMKSLPWHFNDTERLFYHGDADARNSFGFYFGHSGPVDPRVIIPYWGLLVAFAALTAVPWLRYRFSLRTLLIATTLIAVVLGLIVATRQ